MSSSDYTSLRRLKHMHKPPVNGADNYISITPQCNSDPHCKVNYYYITPSEGSGSMEINRPGCNDSLVVTHDNSHHGIRSQLGDKYISNSANKYIITPIKNGSVTFTIDSCLSHAKGTHVVCTNSENQSQYFEGTIYDYNIRTGEITIYKIDNINGAYTQPATYTVTLMSGNQEFIKMQNRVNDMYELLFKIDLTKPENYNYDLLLNQYLIQISKLYMYFFEVDITEDDDFELNESVLNDKMNELYCVFFDIADLDIYLKKHKHFNPNNNKIKLNSLKDKISQLYLYFFNTDISQTIFSGENGK